MKIKPCPFCGGNGVYKAVIYTGIGKHAWVECEKCFARIEKIPISDEYCAKDLAIKTWNERVNE
jgi:Lar family restriction alleviation protein